MNATTSSNRDGIALLVIDVQTALFERATPLYKADDLLRNITMLIGRAREANVPVFYVQHANNSLLSEGSAGWQLHPQLQAIPPDGLIHKRHGSAFEETPLKGILDARNVGTVVIAADAHSNYHKQAAKLIAEWNQTLQEAGATVLPTAEVSFR